MSTSQIAVILHLDVDYVNRWSDDGNDGEAAIATAIGDFVIRLLHGSGVELADVEWLDEAKFHGLKDAPLVDIALCAACGREWGEHVIVGNAVSHVYERPSA